MFVNDPFCSISKLHIYGILFSVDMFSEWAMFIKQCLSLVMLVVTRV